MKNISIGFAVFGALFTIVGCSSTPRSTVPVDPFSSLTTGNDRFLHQAFHDLSAGQNPKAVVISCSDSRVAPEIIFNQNAGDLFTIRSAGEALSNYDVASAEYAVEHLGTKLIIVMGHSSCGAVKTAVTTPVGQSAGSKNLDQLVAKLRPQLGQYDANDGELIQAAKNNVDATANDLIARSEILKKDLDENKIEIKHALYHLKNGQVDIW
jgi:carbonic anhydrase